jgi:hypothetical protein
LRPSLRTIRDSTTGTSTLARLSLTSRGSSLPVATVRVTDVPARPLIRVVASSDDAPLSGRPLTAVISSPGLSPPLAAGEPLNTVRMRSPFGTSSTFIPTPSKAPWVASSNDL